MQPSTCVCRFACSLTACLPDLYPLHLPLSFPGLQGCLIGSRLFIFGGEDAMRRPLGELLVLDLATWQWSRPETSGAWPGAW
jgi:hypothetical protein